MSGVTVEDAGDLRKYRTEIPNIVLTMGLSPHALALYVHLKRTCGTHGKSWKATKTLATEANMSAGKVSEARAELERHKLISLVRPKERTKSVEVTIADVWERNFKHFLRVQNMNATRSEYEPKKEPLEEGVVNTKAFTTAPPNVVSLEKHIIDSIYDTMSDANLRLPNEHFKYHLGRAKDVIAKDNPTDEEVEQLPEWFVRTWKIYGKADAHSALMEMRRQPARAAIIEEGRENGKEAGFYERQEANVDKPRNPGWYTAFLDADEEQVVEWIAAGATHSQIEKRLKEERS